jgi:hypothetical protein
VSYRLDDAALDSERPQVRWNGDGPASSASAEAAAPNIVARPVLTTSAIASPEELSHP